MPAYEDAPLSPSAPVARVTLKSGTGGAVVTDIPMLLDTGASVTLIPAFAVTALGIDVSEQSGYELEGFNGATSEAYAVRLEMIFEGRTFRGEFLVIDQQWGIIGRNILNILSLSLDGPRLTWSVNKAI